MKLYDTSYKYYGYGTLEVSILFLYSYYENQEWIFNGVCIAEPIIFFLLKKGSGSACTGISPKPSRTVYVSPELKEWGLFKAGSYWIYRDSIAGNLDSVYVSSVYSTFENVYPTPDSVVMHETIHVRVKGSSSDFYTLKADNIISYPSSSPYNTTLPCFILDTAFSSPGFLGQVNNTVSSVNVFGNVYTTARHYRVGICYSIHSGQNYCVSNSHFWKKHAGRIKTRSYYTSGPNIGGVYNSQEVIRYHVMP